MSVEVIPPNLVDWDSKTIDILTKLRDIESETFDFKGKDMDKLYQHICAMANTHGGFLIIGVDPNKPDSENPAGFKKNGFDKYSENLVDNEIRNHIVRIEPKPDCEIKIIPDEEKFYVVLKIKNNVLKKPFCIKEQGVFYARIGSSSTLASRTTILDLFADSSKVLENIRNLKQSAVLLKEELLATAEQILCLSEKNQVRATLVDLTLIRHAVLTSQTFLIENDLFGQRISDGWRVGITTFIHKLESLNTYLNAFNTSNEVEIKKSTLNFLYEWGSNRTNTKDVIDFLNKMIQKIDEFLQKHQEF